MNKPIQEACTGAESQALAVNVAVYVIDCHSRRMKY